MLWKPHAFGKERYFGRACGNRMHSNIDVVSIRMWIWQSNALEHESDNGVAMDAAGTIHSRE